MRLYIDHRNRNTESGKWWAKRTFWEKCHFAYLSFELVFSEFWWQTFGDWPTVLHVFYKPDDDED